MHESYHIRKPVTQRIFNAFDFAESKDQPFNYFIVIHLNDGVEKAAYTAITEMFCKYRRWLEYRRKLKQADCPPLYVFTQENPSNNPHFNWCLHIPPKAKRDFEKKILIWVEKVEGSVGVKKVEVRRIQTKGYKAIANYIVKGTDPDHLADFFLTELHDLKGSQGLIYGRRAGVSRALGPMAIRRAGFNPTAYRRYKRHFVYGRYNSSDFHE